MFVKEEAVLENPSGFNQLTRSWIVFRFIDDFDGFLKSEENLLQLAMRYGIVASRCSLAKPQEKQRVFADVLDWL
jgi:hypothetical protein